MAGKVVNSSLVLLSKFVASRQESASKTATSHIRDTLPAIEMIIKSKTLIAVALIFTLASCRESESQYAVISTDLSHRFAITEISELSRNEITILEQLIVECISEYNEEIRKSSELQESELSHFLIMEFDNYKRQYVPVINEIGEKIIWVNAFCSAPNDWDWHSQILGTQDGGNCYFSLSVNITQKTCNGIQVNGYA